MSAIVGIYYRDGQPVDPASVSRMLNEMAHRGPDGSGVVIDGPVALGHQALWTTPEATGERQPHRQGQQLLVADARIDNREELIPFLGMGASASDSQLILAAYMRWGEACPEHLVGDFAFAIWDGSRQLLFCARDHIGVKPLYYQLSEKVIAFATEIKALLALDDNPPRLNDRAAAAYLSSVFEDTTATLYDGVLRLPPAHRVVVTRDLARVERYWSLDPTRASQLESDEAYTAEFRRLFEQAVQCRLRSPGAIGAMLSGGLDSSSVTCVAAASHVSDFHTFSQVYDNVPECDEREFQQSVLDQLGQMVTAHQSTADDVRPFDSLDDAVRSLEGPLYGPGISQSRALYRAASEHGVRVLLDGHGGDETISHGFGLIRELALKGEWIRVVRELRGLARLYNDPFWPMLRACFSVWMGARIERSRVLRRLTGIAQRLRPRKQSIPIAQGPLPGFVRPDVVKTLAPNTAPATRRGDSDVPPERAAHFRLLTAGLQPFALEILDKAAAAFGVEPRYPFLDRRLIEFCLAMPAHHKLRDGWTRFVLRKAMDGLLPAEVQWRTTKINFMPNLCRGLRMYELDALAEVIDREPRLIERFVDLPTLRRAYRQFLTQGPLPPSEEIQSIWRVVTLGLWLQRTRLQWGA